VRYGCTDGVDSIAPVKIVRAKPNGLNLLSLVFNFDRKHNILLKYCRLFYTAFTNLGLKVIWHNIFIMTSVAIQLNLRKRTEKSALSLSCGNV